MITNPSKGWLSPSRVFGYLLVSSILYLLEHHLCHDDYVVGDSTILWYASAMQEQIVGSAWSYNGEQTNSKSNPERTF